MNKPLCICILFILGIVASCSTLSTLKLNIPDDYEEIVVKNKYGEGVYSLYCKINGKVNGHLEIEFSNGENLSEKIVAENGKINFKYEGDWYADEFIIKIIPNRNVIGSMNIIYSFGTLSPLTLY